MRRRPWCADFVELGKSEGKSCLSVVHGGGRHRCNVMYVPAAPQPPGRRTSAAIRVRGWNRGFCAAWSARAPRGGSARDFSTCRTFYFDDVIQNVIALLVSRTRADVPRTRTPRALGPAPAARPRATSAPRIARGAAARRGRTPGESEQPRRQRRVRRPGALSYLCYIRPCMCGDVACV